MTNGRGLTLPQLRTHVAAVQSQVPPERAGVIGLRTVDGWEGPGTIDCDGRTYTVVRATSPLAVREAVDGAAGRESSLVLLTPLEPAELGQDLVARFAGGRLYSIDLWEAVRGLFKARQIDPTVRGRAVARSLLDNAPPAGYPPVPAGVLDAGTAWRCLTRHAFGMGDREPDVPGLLRWASGPAVERYRSAPAELRDALRRRLAETLGAAAESVLNLIDSGAAPDALALAVVFGVVFEGGTAPPELRETAARLERFHNNTPIPPVVGVQLARAAADALREIARDGPAIDAPHRERADRILREVRAERHAHRSALTPLGLEQRFELLAGAVRRAAGEEPPTPDAVRAAEDSLREVTSHALAERHPVRVEQARMAVRLVRWTLTPGPAAGELGDSARRYRDDLAFVDWGRDVLAGGDPLPAVTAAYRALEGVVRHRRSTLNREFSVCLRDAAARPAAPDSPMPVENVLDRVLVPLVQAGHGVLLVVLDGMSWAIAQELLVGLRVTQWQEMTLSPDGEPPPPLLATIPSVTEQSRASLLAGRRSQGDSGQEKRGFAEHPALAAACGRRYPPRLFHKGELTEGGRGGLAGPVGDAVLGGEHRVVGVVVNAIDDRLATAQQVRDRWGADTIRPLGPLLHAARDAGRVVVLASDHGHVWHRDDCAFRPADGGERWRPAGGQVRTDEVLLEGPRVRGGGGEQRAVVPWDEPVRYGPAKNGYHGGATPQEMLAPLIILAPAGVTRKGLSASRLPTPGWWDDAPPPAPSQDESVPPKPAATPRTDVLFDPHADAPGPTPAPEVPAGTVPDRLLASAVYAAQKQAVGKHPPDDATVRRCLGALERHGGTLTPAALAQQAGVLPLRLDGLLAKLQRVLNVDGYEVLQVDRAANRVTLNAALLARQFDLDRPAAG